jgi:hypothetical protein
MMHRTIPSAVVLVAALVAGCVYDGSVKAPGDPRAFDAVAVLPEVDAFAGDDAKLVSIEAEYVRPDGTADTRASYVDRSDRVAVYRFIVPFEPPATPKRDASVPLGVGPGPTQWPELEGIEVEIVRPYWVNSVVVSGNTRSESVDKHRGMRNKGLAFSVATEPLTEEEREWESHLSSHHRQVRLEHVVPPPACTFQTLWSEAIARGVPSDAVATIRYDHRGYLFEIRHTEHALQFDQACRPRPLEK